MEEQIIIDSTNDTMSPIKNRQLTLSHQFIDLLIHCPTGQQCRTIDELIIFLTTDPAMDDQEIESEQLHEKLATKLLDCFAETPEGQYQLEQLESWFTDNITQDLLFDPWMTPLKHVFDRSTLELLAKCSLEQTNHPVQISCPLTRNLYSLQDLKPATQVKLLVQIFHQLLALRAAPKTHHGLKLFEQIQQQCIHIPLGECRLICAMMPQRHYLIRQMGSNSGYQHNRFVLVTSDINTRRERNSIQKLSFLVNDDATLSPLQDLSRRFDSIESILKAINLSHCLLFNADKLAQFRASTQLHDYLAKSPASEIRALIAQLECQYSCQDIADLKTKYPDCLFVRSGNNPTSTPSLTKECNNKKSLKILLKDGQFFKTNATQFTVVAGVVQFAFQSQDPSFRAAVLKEYQQLIQLGLIDPSSVTGIIFTSIGIPIALNNLFSPQSIEEPSHSTYNIEAFFKDFTTNTSDK